MKEKRTCKIVQDLLPNYIEKLTDEETNKYIEEHINQCEECKNILENMKKGLKQNKTETNKKKITFMKKYKNKLRILRIIILIIFLTILLTFIVTTARKMIIISDLCAKAQKCENSTNFHMTYSHYCEGEYVKEEIFILDDKIKLIDTYINDEEMTKVISIGTRDYNTPNKTDNNAYAIHTYYQSGDQKIAVLKDYIYGEMKPYNMFNTKNIWDLFKRSVNISIKEKTIRGKKCYYIENFQPIDSSKREGVYVDKEYGLEITSDEFITTNISWDDENEKQIYTPQIAIPIESTYEFETVTEEDFIEPDISEYNDVREKFYDPDHPEQWLEGEELENYLKAQEEMKQYNEEKQE